MKRIRRLIHLIQLLQRGEPIPLADLRRELGVSRRTIFRDLSTLELAGLPCTFDRQRQGYVLEHSRFLPPVMLSLEEGLGLMLLTRRAVHRRFVPGYRPATAAAMKIEAALPAAVRKHCGELLDGVDLRYWPMSDVESTRDVLPLLQRALADHKKVALRYDSYKEKREIETVLHPYRMSFLRRGWYVIGLSERYKQVLTFKIERIVNMRVLRDTYVPDPEFDLDDYFGNAWQMIRGDKRYHVVIRFSPMMAGNVEEVAWHRTQQTERLADGGLLFEVDVDGIKEIAWWILGYGKEAIVQEPPELRQLVAEHARAMAACYDDDRPASGGSA
ncbi:MAG: helix-turn-helix transcriptional regulator [Planctomycetota bacterium]|jgi:proteasome accessory factor B